MLIDTRDWFKEISEKISAGLKSRNTIETELKRALIVIFENEKVLREFYNSHFFNEFRGPKADIIHERLTNDEKKDRVKKACYEGHITLCTRTFGRGTDFSCSEKVERAGGVHIIQTFFTEDISEEVQIRGRTRRQGSPGSF